MSEYLRKLQTDNREAYDGYKMKISVIKDIDPLTLSSDEISTNPMDFPLLQSIDIVSYLVLTKSYYTKQQWRAFRSLSAYKYFDSGFVSDCGVVKIEENFVIIGKVKHSQRLNLPPLQAWIICHIDGSVETAHCTCMAGLGEACSHIGALLFAAEYIVAERDNTSCTDSHALWEAPSMSEAGYLPLREMECGEMINYQTRTDVAPLNNEEIVSLLNDIEKAGSSSVLMRIVEPFATKIANKMKEDTLSRKSNLQHIQKKNMKHSI